MNRVLLFLTFLALFSISKVTCGEETGRALAPTNVDLKVELIRELIAFEQVLMDAVMHKDAETLKRLVSENFTAVDASLPSKVQNRADWLGYVLGPLSIASYNFRDLHVNLSGDIAIVSTLYSQKAALEGVELSEEYLGTDLWIKRDNRWQITARLSMQPIQDATKSWLGSATGPLQAIQSVGIIVAILFTLYQTVRFRRDTERQLYLEIDKRYVEFLKQTVDLDRPPMGYDMSRVQHFLSLGGTTKELLVYDLLFSTWESAFLLYVKKQKSQWHGWENWIRAFFVGHQRSYMAWEIAGHFFDAKFVKYVNEEILPSLDARVSKSFPETQDKWCSLPVTIDNSGLKVGEFQVMQWWEEPLMRAMAEVVALPGASVLEVGFGLGLASEFIQLQPVGSHTIVEAHPNIYKNLAKWAQGRNSVKPVFAPWEKWAPSVPDESFDSILFDTFPLRRSELHRNHFPFFSEAERLLKPGGLFTYYSDEAVHVCPDHQVALLSSFTGFSVRSISLTPSSDCEYWQEKSMLLIVAQKSKDIADQRVG